MSASKFSRYVSRSLSAKQVNILQVIEPGSVDDYGQAQCIDLDQIIERLPYQTTKQSLQFSLRALVRHGLIRKNGNETRRGRIRVLYCLTDDGKTLMAGEAGDKRREERIKHAMQDPTDGMDGVDSFDVYLQAAAEDLLSDEDTPSTGESFLKEDEPSSPGDDPDYPTEELE